MNLRWLDKSVIKLIENFSNEIYGKNRRGNKQRLVRDAILYAENNKQDFIRWLNLRNVSVAEAIKRMGG